MDFEIEVNGIQMKAKPGETVLSVLRKNGMVVPTLCHMNRFSPTGACRLCVVEVEGISDLRSSCSLPAEKGLKVFTNTQRVINARKLVVEMLLANHPDDCLYCERNKNCELQTLADELNIKERVFFGKKRKHYPDRRSSSVFYDPAKCVLCSRCVRVCEEIQYVNALDFISKGHNTLVGTAFNKALNASSCINCGQCTITCPTGALGDISHSERVQAAIDNNNKEVAFLVSPAVVASLVEYFGLKENSNSRGIVSSALRRVGASKVFDLSGAILWNISEEARLLQQNFRKKNSGPLFSSCCPSWVKFSSEHFPQLESRVSPVKSPQQATGKFLKTKYCSENGIDPDNLFIVSVMPCVANKYEATLKSNTINGISEVDAVLTVREITRLIRTRGVDIRSLSSSNFDNPMNNTNPLAWKSSYSGGKAESVARTLYQNEKKSLDGFKFYLPKNQDYCKETKLRIDDETLTFAWISGIRNAKEYLDKMLELERDDLHYIEVMACQGGCTGGGGQHVSRGNQKVVSRKKTCQVMEKVFETTYYDYGNIFK